MGTTDDQGHGGANAGELEAAAKLVLENWNDPTVFNMLKPERDRVVTRAIESFKNNHYEADVKTAAEKQLKEKQAELGEIEKLVSALRLKESELNRKARVIERWGENEIPPAVVLRLIADTDEETDANFSTLETFLKNRDLRVRNELMAKGPAPQAGDTPLELTPDQYLAMSDDAKRRLPKAIYQKMMQSIGRRK